MRPLIALTTTLTAAGAHKLPSVTLNVQYVRAVEDPGGTALLLNPAQEEQTIRQLVGLSHGLLLTGGEDVDPKRYGAEPHPQLGTVTPARDELEIVALDEALQRKMPILAICRGVQLLNVALGGTLFQDLPSQRPGPVVHEQSAPVGHRWHTARVEDGSGLHAIFGASELFINSFHHQGIEQLAPRLVATAWAEDGLIEGVEGREHPWMFGVQWHPERGEADAPGDDRDPDRRLMWEFVNAARRFASGELSEAAPAGARVA